MPRLPGSPRPGRYHPSSQPDESHPDRRRDCAIARNRPTAAGLRHRGPTALRSTRSRAGDQAARPPFMTFSTKFPMVPGQALQSWPRAFPMPRPAGRPWRRGPPARCRWSGLWSGRTRAGVDIAPCGSLLEGVQGGELRRAVARRAGLPRGLRALRDGDMCFMIDEVGGRIRNGCKDCCVFCNTCRGWGLMNG